MQNQHLYISMGSKYQFHRDKKCLTKDLPRYNNTYKPDMDVLRRLVAAFVEFRTKRKI